MKPQPFTEYDSSYYTDPFNPYDCFFLPEDYLEDL